MSIKLIDDIDKYSDLIMSVGVQGNSIKGERPLIPIEVANRIKRMIDENEESLSETAHRLGLGRGKSEDPYDSKDTTQIRCFLNLLKLSPRSSMTLGFGRSDPDKIPFSTGSEIAKLDSHDEQDKVIQSALEHDLRKEDAQKIVRYRNEHQESTIEECIEQVLQVTPVQSISNVVCCTLDRQFADKIEPIVNRLAERLSMRLDGIVSKTRIKGKIIMVFMDDRAFTTLKREQKKQNSTFSQYINSIIGEIV